MAGDFNIHVDDVANGDLEAFLSTLDSYGLSQHVLNSTHNLRHTLDLLISGSDDNIIKSVSVNDRFWINAELNIYKPPLPKKEISFRKTRNIDVTEFINYISNPAVPQNIDEFEYATELVIAYNEILTKPFNNHAPLKTKTVTVHPQQPWYAPKIAEAKKLRWKLNVDGTARNWL